MYKNQKGAIAPLLIVGLLIVGILLTTNLVKIPQFWKPKAGGGLPISIVAEDGSALTKVGDAFVTSSPKVKVVFNSAPEPDNAQSQSPYLAKRLGIRKYNETGRGLTFFQGCPLDSSAQYGTDFSRCVTYKAEDTDLFVGSNNEEIAAVYWMVLPTNTGKGFITEQVTKSGKYLRSKCSGVSCTHEHVADVSVGLFKTMYGVVLPTNTGDALIKEVIDQHGRLFWQKCQLLPESEYGFRCAEELRDSGVFTNAKAMYGFVTETKTGRKLVKEWTNNEGRLYRQTCDLSPTSELGFNCGGGQIQDTGYIIDSYDIFAGTIMNDEELGYDNTVTQMELKAAETELLAVTPFKSCEELSTDCFAYDSKGKVRDGVARDTVITFVNKDAGDKFISAQFKYSDGSIKTVGPVKVKYSPSGSTTPVVDPSELKAYCELTPFGYRANFIWPEISVPGKTVQNYTLRVNKAPGDVWNPEILSLNNNLAGIDSDFVLQVGNVTKLEGVGFKTHGTFAGWDVTPGFEGETSEAVEHRIFGPAFSCPVSGGGGGGAGGG